VHISFLITGSFLFKLNRFPVDSQCRLAAVLEELTSAVLLKRSIVDSINLCYVVLVEKTSPQEMIFEVILRFSFLLLWD